MSQVDTVLADLASVASDGAPVTGGMETSYAWLESLL